MKKKRRLPMIVLLGIFLLLAGTIVQAQAAPYSLIIDEYGPGYYKDLGSSNPQWITWNGAMRSDPTWTGHTSLVYIGYRSDDFTGYFDVLVKEPTGEESDILRIWNDPADPLSLYTWIIFYSADTSGGAPADTGLPSIRNVFDTVSEGSDGIFYWTPPAGSAQYKGYSEGRASVPEPTTMLLLGLGLIGLAGVRRRMDR